MTIKPDIDIDKIISHILSLEAIALMIGTSELKAFDGELQHGLENLIEIWIDKLKKILNLPEPPKPIRSVPPAGK